MNKTSDDKLDEILRKRSDHYLFEVMREYGIDAVVQALHLHSQRWDAQRRDRIS